MIAFKNVPKEGRRREEGAKRGEKMGVKTTDQGE